MNADLTIDRLAPCSKPQGRTSMRQNWAHLAFLHWRVDPEALRPLIPAELEIDTFDGSAFVGLVPFTMTGIRPIWAPPVAGLSSFHEVNVRTYVHFRGRDPGVWFFSLDASNPIAVALARKFWRLPYHRAAMRLEIDRSTGWIDYSSDRLWPGPLPGRCSLRFRPNGPAEPATPGTLEHFLAERYILYTAGRSSILSGRVHHSPYPLQVAEVADLDESLIAAAGIERSEDAPMVHYASGVRVRVYPLRRIGEPGRALSE